MKGQDRETRERLLDAATRLFAERGFAKVTVRDICLKARANVAAVNYHFGGKAGLYDQVVTTAIQTMQTTTTAARAAGERRHPREQLTAYISVFLTRVVEARDSWIHQLMRHELTDPTPAFDRVVDEVIRPRTDYLAEVIAAILECRRDDERVEQCLFSVQSQILGLMKHPVAARMLQEPEMTAARVGAMAKHITQFSLAGLREIARSRASSGQRAKVKGQRAGQRDRYRSRAKV